MEEFEKINFPFLTSLYSENNNISNIKILCEQILNQLKILVLAHNNITDISSFREFYMPNIETNKLYYNKKQNIERLLNADFRKLVHLNIWDNAIEDISPLIK